MHKIRAQKGPHLGLTGRTAGKVEKGDLGLSFAGLELTLDETLVQPQTLLYERLHGDMGASRNVVEHHDARVWYTGLTRGGHGRAQRHRMGNDERRIRDLNLV